MQPAAEAMARLPWGIDICYDTFGESSDPAVVMVMGLAGPLTWWDSRLCAMVAGQGFYVVRFDNRDVGRSTWLSGPRISNTGILRAAVRGAAGRPPYTMSDLATDVVGLLDHLGVAAAHVVGASMGGMIAQTLAIEHPERVLSLVSMMSTTGRRSVGWFSPRLLPTLLRPNRSTREAYVRSAARTWKAIGSPGYPVPPDEVARRAGETFDRGVSQAGVNRQLAAILAQTDRTEALRRLQRPTTVLHGLADRLVHASGGRATAAAVTGAQLVLVPGLGHDLPEALYPTFTSVITATTRRTGSAHA